MDDGAAGDHSACLAGADRRGAGRLPPGHDAFRLARNSCDTCGFSHHDHQNLEPVQLSAEAGACRGCLGAAFGPHGAVAAGREVAFCRVADIPSSAASRATPTVRLGATKWIALAFVFVVLLCPVFLPYGALVNATFSRVATSFMWIDNFTLHNIYFVFFELSATQLALKNTFLLGVAFRDHRHAHGAGDRLSHHAARHSGLSDARVSRHCSGCNSGDRAWRWALLELCAAAACPLRHLWILLIAFVTIALPAAYQQLQSAFRSVHTDLEDASRILGSTRLRTLRDITAPLLRTSVIATWCFIFVGVIRELSAAIMLFTSETKVISVLIFDLNDVGRSRRDLGAGPDHARNHVCGRDRGQPHPRLRRRPAA